MVIMINCCSNSVVLNLAKSTSVLRPVGEAWSVDLDSDLGSTKWAFNHHCGYFYLTTPLGSHNSQETRRCELLEHFEQILMAETKSSESTQPLKLPWKISVIYTIIIYLLCFFFLCTKRLDETGRNRGNCFTPLFFNKRRNIESLDFTCFRPTIPELPTPSPPLLINITTAVMSSQ